MALSRVVNTGFWTDSKVLDMSPEDKYFMLYLLTNPHTTQLGIYELNKKQAAFEMGYSGDTVDNLITRFENKYSVIRYSKTTNEVAIKNYLIYSIIKGGKPVEDCLKKEISRVKDKSLIDFVFAHLHDKQNTNETVKGIVAQYLICNDNDNDNDNDVSSHDTPTIREESKKRFQKPTIEEIATYCRDRDNRIDPNAFYDFYESKGWLIGKTPMKDWKAAVRTWEQRNPKPKKEDKPCVKYTKGHYL